MLQVEREELEAGLIFPVPALQLAAFLDGLLGLGDEPAFFLGKQSRLWGGVDGSYRSGVFGSVMVAFRWSPNRLGNAAALRF